MERGTFYLHYYDIDDVTSARMLEKLADLGKENFLIHDQREEFL